ncbi:MAG: DUF1552 domain-containing protein, partial [Pseudomonadota bacterium]
MTAQGPDSDQAPSQLPTKSAPTPRFTVVTMPDMMNDIIVLAFACGLKRAATLQIGNGNDGTRYPIGGPGANYSFHWISHRIEGDGGSGSAPSIENAEYMHYQIDRIHMRMYADLVTKLRDYQ